MKNEIKHTAHSTYRCEYHIVFAPKYRRQEIYGQLKKDIGEIIRKLCDEKKVEILEANACTDHIHMLVSVPPYISIAQFMGFLKGKSTLMIFDRHANLKYKYGNRHFWCRGYYVDTVGRNERVITEEFSALCPNHTLKDLRHTFTTRARECGIDNELVAVWTRHSLGNITSSVYTHFSMEFQKEQAVKLKYII